MRLGLLVDALAWRRSRARRCRRPARRPRRCHHGAVEPAARREDARRVDEDELRRRRRSRCRATSARVVCTFGVTIETLAPTSALISVDLPALGAPISATKPQRVLRCGRLSHRARSGLTPSRVSMAAAAACSAARLERPDAFGGRELGQLAPRREIPDRGPGPCARPRDRPASAGRAPAPIPAASSWDRAAARAGVRMRSSHSRSISAAAAG